MFNFAQKFLNAFHGLYILIKEEKSLWVHLIVTILVIFFGLLFKLDLTEWCLITLAIGFVIGFEIINTAIEYVVDIVSFEYSLKAKKIKDVSAMATLFATLISSTIGLLIFIPEFIQYFGGTV